MTSRNNLRDKLFLIGWSIIVASGDYLRENSGILFIVAVVLLVLSSAAEFFRSRNFIPISFTLLVLSYIVLSYAHLLPAGWTRYHDAAYIPQQSAGILSFGILLIACRRWWERVLSGAVPTRHLYFVLLLALGSLILINGLGASEDSGPRVFASLRNNAMTFLVIITFLAFAGKRWAAWAFVVLASMYILLGLYFLQTSVALLIAVICYLGVLAKLRVGRAISLVLVFTAVTAVLVGLNHPIETFRLDYNTGWRLRFWAHGIDLAVQTHGAGVGFGTEALMNLYPELERGRFIENEFSDDFMLIGSHSGFIDVLIRMGVLGFLFLLGVFVRSFPTARFSIPAENHAGFVFCLAFLTVFSNVALQSPLYSAGVAFALAYLWAQRSRATV